MSPSNQRHVTHAFNHLVTVAVNTDLHVYPSQHAQMLVVRKEGKAHQRYNSFRSAFELLEVVGHEPKDCFEELQDDSPTLERLDQRVNELMSAMQQLRSDMQQQRSDMQKQIDHLKEENEHLKKSE